MQIAQRLFQGMEIGNGEIEGLITYHRTDSTTLSDKAINESARVIRDMFGDEYYDGPRRYQTKVKNAQEAHEAIRPTDFRQTPQQLASILESRRAAALRPDLEAHDGVADGGRARRQDDARDHGAGRRRRFGDVHGVGQGDRVRRVPSRVRRRQRRSGSRARGSGDDPADVPGGRSRVRVRGDAVRQGGPGVSRARRRSGTRRCRRRATPKPRSSRSSKPTGIGRPSTYASIIATIQNRGYVFRQGKALVPSFTAFAVTELLRQHFTDYVDVGFTAEMEEVLDADQQRRARLARLRARVLPRRRQAHGPRGADRPADRRDRLSG